MSFGNIGLILRTSIFKTLASGCRLHVLENIQKYCKEYINVKKFANNKKNANVKKYTNAKYLTNNKKHVNGNMARKKYADVKKNTNEKKYTNLKKCAIM